MLERIDLNLMIGPAVPVPAPRELVEALSSAQVTTSARQPSGFQLEFQLSPRSPLIAVLLAGSAILRVVLFVTLRGLPVVLIDGVVTDSELTPGTGGGASTLRLTGSDLSAVMDLISFDGFLYPATPPFARVNLMLSTYAALGVAPLVVPSLLTTVENPAQSTPKQIGTDLNYIKVLANQSGYVFYLEPTPVPGTSVAYWGPEVKTGVPQPALNADMDVRGNVDSLSFRLDTEKPTQYLLWVQEPITKLSLPIPVPNVSLLNPPLGAIPPIAKKYEPLQTANLDPVRAALLGLSKQAETFDNVTANGSLDVRRYGGVLQARRLVGVRGAGDAFDGLYFVQSVTHNIKRGEYKQSFTLSRSGLVSTVPVVPV